MNLATQILSAVAEAGGEQHYSAGHRYSAPRFIAMCSCGRRFEGGTKKEALDKRREHFACMATEGRAELERAGGRD